MIETKIYKPTAEAIEHAAKLLLAGDVVGIPTETVYGLAANIYDEAAVLKIFATKRRPADNPLIVHISDFSQMLPVVKEVTPLAKALADAFWPGPLTIIMPKGEKIPYAVTAGLETVAVRFPEHPVALRMIKAAGVPIAAPSANLSGKPSPTTAKHVFDDMNGRIPLIIDGGACEVGLESTVVDATREGVVLLRPGGVTREMLQDVLGQEVMLGKGVMEPLQDGEKALSPGLLHKHYAPKAKVKVIIGDDTARVEYIRNHAAEDEKPCVLCLDQNASRYGDLPVLSAGNTPEDYAHNLFAALRSADDIGYTDVYAEGLSMDGVGLAVMNRIERAAGFHIIKV